MSAQPPDRRRGAALFIVLMLSALLAGLAAAAMRTGVSAARAAAVFADAARADELGRAAGDVLAYHLLDADAEAHRGGSLAVRLADAEIAIDYVSESARIDANAAPVPLISALLSAAGADPALIAAVAERIGRLRAVAGGGQQPRRTISEYGSASSPAPAGNPQGPAAPPAVQTPAQVVDAWGVPDDLARRVIPALTVANGSNQVDPVLADRLVVSALLGGDDARVDDYLQRREQGFVDTDSALALLPVPSQAFAGFDDVPAVRAIARVTVAHRFERHYEMVLAPPSGPGQAPVVVSWRKLL